MPLYLSARFGQVKHGSSGLPVSGYDVRIFNDEGKELTANEVGHLVAIGPTGTRYWRREKEQAESVKGGWNYTGNLAYIDADDFFLVCKQKR